MTQKLKVPRSAVFEEPPGEFSVSVFMKRLTRYMKDIPPDATVYLDAGMLVFHWRDWETDAEFEKRTSKISRAKQKRYEKYLDLKKEFE